MLTVIHIREIVQFAAYLGCFRCRAVCVRVVSSVCSARGGAARRSRWSWPRPTRAWQSADGAGGQRYRQPRSARISSRLASAMSRCAALIASSAVETSSATSCRTSTRCSPGHAVLPVCRRRSSSSCSASARWSGCISSSTLAYLRVMTVPLLAIPYIYLTYFEILQIPVRNMIFFLYLLAGGARLLVVVKLRGRGPNEAVAGRRRRDRHGNARASGDAHRQSYCGRLFRAADCGIRVERCLGLCGRSRRGSAREPSAIGVIAADGAVRALARPSAGAAIGPGDVGGRPG